MAIDKTKDKEVVQVAKELKIPLKNLKRWIIYGSKRKEGIFANNLSPINNLEFYKMFIYI